MKYKEDYVHVSLGDKIHIQPYQRITFTAKDIIKRLNSEACQETVNLFNYAFDVKQRARVRAMIFTALKKEAK
jgi:hypothetical protein